MMVETYLRRGQRSLERAALCPGVRRTAAAAVCAGSGFLLSAVGLRGIPQPVAAGLIVSAAGWRAVLMALGSMLGYPTFWGMAGAQGILWAATAGLLAVMAGSRQETRDQPLMLPVIGSFLTLAAGLCFQLLLDDPVSWLQIPLRGAVALGSGILFVQSARCRDPVTDWLIQGVGVLSLARLSGGIAWGAAAALAVGGPLPAAVLAGTALDLSGGGQISGAAVMCLASFLGMLPLDRKWQTLLMPGLAYGVVAAIRGIWDPAPLPGLLLGGALGLLLPPKPRFAHRRGETGAAQIRLELGAQMLLSVRQTLLDRKILPVDQEAILEKARQRACGSCPLQRSCAQYRDFSPSLLENPLEADCRKQGRLVPELRRAREQLRLLQADRKRQQEYRTALAQQYQFLSAYLQKLSDGLPRRVREAAAAFRIEAAVQSRGKEEANGDSCLTFAGTQCRYYVLLCDGMGTGLGAAREGYAAGKQLRQMLTCGFPAEYALQSLNSLLALGGCAGAVTLDLAEIALDTGIAHIYKWGAAPSWVLTRRGAEKIGTATPPPGIGVDSVSMQVEKLSLRRGEMLILLSDGVDSSVIQGLDADSIPEEAAKRILTRGCLEGDDDATAAVLRLHPVGISTA